MVKCQKASVPDLLYPECQWSGNLFILIILILVVLLYKSSLSMSILGIFGTRIHRRYCHVFLQWICGPLFEVVRMDPWQFFIPLSLTLSSPQDSLSVTSGDCAKFRWQGFSAGRFRSGDPSFFFSGCSRVGAKNFEMVVWEWVCFFFLGGGNGWTKMAFRFNLRTKWNYELCRSNKTQNSPKMRKIEARKPLNRIWGDPMRHTRTRCFVGL